MAFLLYEMNRFRHLRMAFRNYSEARQRYQIKRYKCFELRYSSPKTILQIDIRCVETLTRVAWMIDTCRQRYRGSTTVFLFVKCRCISLQKEIKLYLMLYRIKLSYSHFFVVIISVLFLNDIKNKRG